MKVQASQVHRPPGTAFALPIPPNCAYPGATLSAQGASIDANLGISLTSALDITIGTY